MYDLIVKDAVIVDGTGRAGFRGDVGIVAGRTADVGPLDGPSRRRLDAEGLVLAPGFVDIHTHYDAQVQWDPLLMPSSLHGVTTAIGGNCGFTVAPLAPGGADYIGSMLARVEGIPLAAIQSALAWDWSSFGDWLDRLETTMAVNVGFLVGHSTLRRAVLGEAAVSRAATPEEITAMASLLGQSLSEGGLGLSSSWTEAHSDGNGDPVPSRAARLEELVALASVVRDHEGTTLEFVPGLGSFGPREVEAMTAMSIAADRPVNWNLIRIDEPDSASADQRLAASDDAKASGAAILALVHPEPTQVRTSLATGVVFENLPGWRDFIRLPLTDRITALGDPARRAQLLAAVEAQPLKWPLSILARWDRLTVAETFSAANRRLAGRTVGDVAGERGSTPFDAMADIALADDLATYFSLERRGDDDATWRTRLRVWRDERTIIGGSDAGAHVDVMCGATYTTSLLGEAVRKRGLLTLEEAVHHLTEVPARLYGLKDRGRVAPGFWADLVVLDPDRVGNEPLHTRADLPGGASRLFAAATGIEHVVVNGAEILRRGIETGDRPGAVLRSGRDTHTVTAQLHA